MSLLVGDSTGLIPRRLRTAIGAGGVRMSD